jgi:hypothetical protein
MEPESGTSPVVLASTKKENLTSRNEYQAKRWKKGNETTRKV